MIFKDFMLDAYKISCKSLGLKINKNFILDFNNQNLTGTDLEFYNKFSTFVGENNDQLNTLIPLIKENILKTINNINESKDNFNLIRKKNLKEFLLDCKKLDLNDDFFLTFLAICVLNSMRASSYNRLSEEVKLLDPTKNSLTVISFVWTMVNETVKLLEIINLTKQDFIVINESFIYEFFFKITLDLSQIKYNNDYLFVLEKTQLDNKTYHIITINDNLVESISKYINILQLPPVILKHETKPMLVSYCIFDSCFVLKQNKTKKNTEVKNEFFDSIKILTNTSFNLDNEMLEITLKNVIEDNNKLIKKKEKKNLEIYNFFNKNDLKLEQFSSENINIENFKKNLFNDLSSENNDFKNLMLGAINFNENILSKLYQNSLNILKQTDNYNVSKIKYLNNLIKIYNKKFQKEINYLLITDNCLSFFEKNWNIFLKKQPKDFIKAFDSILFNFNKKLLKKEKNLEIYNFHKRLKKIKKLTSELFSINSNLVLNNYFVEIYEFFKKNNIKNLYFFVFSDFRGRLYYKSNISIQSNWRYRFIYNFGILEPNYFKNNFTIQPSWLNNDTKLFLEKSNVNFLHLIYVFKAIGFIFKNEIDHVDGFKDYNKIVLFGFKKYFFYMETKIIDLETKDLITFIYYCNIITKVINNKTLYKWYIIQDTTASVNQHMGRFLGFKPESLKYLNLANNNDYFDTYYLYIDELKKYFKDNKVLSDLIKRYLFKRLIMTCNYNVGLDNAKKDFEKLLNEGELLISEKKLLLKSFNKIFFFIKKGFVEKKLYLMTVEDFYKIYFLNEKKELKINFSKFPEWLELCDLRMNNFYYFTKKKDIESKLNDKKITINFVFELNNFDESNINLNKTYVAFLVNLIHAADACYLRKIVIKFNDFKNEIATVHDAFAVSFLHADKLVLVANESFVFKTNIDHNNNNLIIIIQSYTIVN